MADERIIKLVPPVFVSIECPINGYVIREDAYAVRRMLQKAECQPDLEHRYDFILNWLAEKWKVERRDLTENMAIHLNNQVMGLIEEKNKELAEQNFQIASCPTSSEDSPETTPPIA